MQKKWNRFLKRALACVLVVVMTLTAAPLSGFVELELPKWNVGGWLNCVDGWFDSVGEWFSSKASALDATGICGENVTYTYNSSTGELVISGTGAMYNYDSYITAQHSPFHGSGIKSVVIGEGVTSIGNFAFCNCTNLTNITIPSSVSRIYTPAFVGCTGMTEIIVSSANPIYHSSNNCVIRTDDKQLILGCKNCIIPSDGSVTSIGMSAFSECANIESITIPNTVTRIGESAFKRCTKLTNVTIPDSVTEIEKWAFYKCSNLKNVYIGNGVTSIADFAFSDCTRLTSVTIPDNVNNIGWSAFSECTGLKSITIGNGVRYIDLHAFYNCNNLLKINWNAEHVSYCGEDVFGKAGTAGSGIDVVIGDNVKNLPDHMFHVKYNSPKIKSVTIPDSVTSIGDYAFCGCTSLTSITIPDSVTSIGGSAFYGCTSLASITIPDSVTSIGDTAFRNCDGLTSITIPDSVTSIENWTFLDCTSLTSVTIPDSVTSIDSSAFLGCDNLHSVFYMSNIESWLAIEFSSGSSNPLCFGANLYIDNILAEDIVIPNSIQLIPNYAFCGCESLTSITIPDSVTSIGDGAFYGCTSLTSIKVPDSMTNIGSEAFSNCSNLIDIVLPDNVYIGSDAFFETAYYNDKNNWEDGIALYLGNYFLSLDQTFSGTYLVKDGTKYIVESAFKQIGGLTRLDFPNSVLSIAAHSIYGCYNLQTVKIPFVGSHRTKQSSNFDNTFKYIFNQIPEKLTTVIVTDTKAIGTDAFYRCSNLTSITIPDSVTSIGSGAFSGCDNLHNVFYMSNIESWLAIKFSSASANPLYNGANLYIDNILSENIVIPNSIQLIPNYAFCGCKSLTSITIPDSVTSIGSSAFYGCNNLNDVFYMSNIESWLAIEFSNANSNPLDNGANLNINDVLIEDVVIPDSVQFIPNYAFDGYKSLTSITIPDSVTSIGKYAFYGCASLSSITIPDNVTSIGGGAFSGCKSLTSITIPDSVTSIGDRAFASCTSLTMGRIYNAKSFKRT